MKGGRKRLHQLHDANYTNSAKAGPLWNVALTRGRSKCCIKEGVEQMRGRSKGCLNEQVEQMLHQRGGGANVALMRGWSKCCINNGVEKMLY